MESKLTSIILKRGDITKENVDVIVNAANSGLSGGGGVDGAIHREGGPGILDECMRIKKAHGGCPTGSAVMTKGGNLRAKYVIHAVGPVWGGGKAKEAELLTSAYHKSLELASNAGCKTVAFPAISTGAYHYPPEEAADIAIRTCAATAIKLPTIKEIRFVLFSNEMLAIFKKVYDRLQKAAE